MTSSTKSDEHRHFTRIHFNIPIVLLNPENGQTWKDDLIDLSLHGALVSRPSNWTGNIGDIFQIDLFLGQNCNITMEVKTVHIETKTIGFTCLHIDLDSVTHLRRLVELNIGNQDILEREIHELFEISNAS